MNNRLINITRTIGKVQLANAAMQNIGDGITRIANKRTAGSIALGVIEIGIGLYLASVNGKRK